MSQTSAADGRGCPQAALDKWTQLAFKDRFAAKACSSSSGASKYTQLVRCVNPVAGDRLLELEAEEVAAAEAASAAAASKISERERLKKIDKEEIDLPILNPVNRQRLVQARVARKMTQQQLANVVNLRAQVIQELETGRAVADVGVLRKLMRVLGKDVKLSFGKEAV
jgi:DNA-binding XRE family transcriptional regulator